MSASVKIFVAAGAALLVSACTGRLPDAETAAPPANAFAAELQKNYVALARAERDESDFADARTFGNRAWEAASGRPPGPEALDARKLPQETVPALADARARLTAAFARGARETSPREAAMAQTAFDCWMQEQEENIQPGDIAACRTQFADAMDRIEPRDLADRPRPPRIDGLRPTPAVMTVRSSESGVPATRYVVYFAFDGAGLSPEAETEISHAADAARRTGAALVRVTGHADRAGTAAHNMLLSRARADAVVAALRRAGLPDVGVATSGRGETLPLVPTADGVREPRNRRVEIELTH